MAHATAIVDDAHSSCAVTHIPLLLLGFALVASDHKRAKAAQAPAPRLRPALPAAQERWLAGRPTTNTSAAPRAVRRSAAQLAHARLGLPDTWRAQRADLLSRRRSGSCSPEADGRPSRQRSDASGCGERGAARRRGAAQREGAAAAARSRGIGRSGAGSTLSLGLHDLPKRAVLRGVSPTPVLAPAISLVAAQPARYRCSSSHSAWCCCLIADCRDERCAEDERQRKHYAASAPGQARGAP